MTLKQRIKKNVKKSKVFTNTLKSDRKSAKTRMFKELKEKREEQKTLEHRKYKNLIIEVLPEH